MSTVVIINPTSIQPDFLQWPKLFWNGGWSWIKILCLCKLQKMFILEMTKTICDLILFHWYIFGKNPDVVNQTVQDYNPDQDHTILAIGRGINNYVNHSHVIHEYHNSLILESVYVANYTNRQCKEF